MMDDWKALIAREAHGWSAIRDSPPGEVELYRAVIVSYEFGKYTEIAIITNWRLIHIRTDGIASEIMLGGTTDNIGLHGSEDGSRCAVRIGKVITVYSGYSLLWCDNSSIALKVIEELKRAKQQRLNVPDDYGWHKSWR